MKTLFGAHVVVFVAFFAVCGSTYAIDYFPSEPGPWFDYTYGPVTIRDVGNGVFSRVCCDGCIVGSFKNYIVGPTGDLFYVKYGSFAESAPMPEIRRFEPYLLYLDYPLEIGKTWTSMASLFNDFSEDDTVTLSGTVVGSEVVTVPAGSFEVLCVTLQYEYLVEWWLNRTETLWLHIQLGPVNNLEEWTGIVATDGLSWSTVKALYR